MLGDEAVGVEGYHAVRVGNAFLGGIVGVEAGVGTECGEGVLGPPNGAFDGAVMTARAIRCYGSTALVEGPVPDQAVVNEGTRAGILHLCLTQGPVPKADVRDVPVEVWVLALPHAVVSRHGASQPEVVVTGQQRRRRRGADGLVFIDVEDQFRIGLERGGDEIPRLGRQGIVGFGKR